MTHDLYKEDIRIGTLVRGNQNDPANYIRQILPHGFESLSLMFWETLGDKDIPRLAEQIRTELEGTKVVISSLGIFGNPLETGEVDLETLKGWESLIDHAYLFDTDIVAGFAS